MSKCSWPSLACCWLFKISKMFGGIRPLTKLAHTHNRGVVKVTNLALNLSLWYLQLNYEGRHILLDSCNAYTRPRRISFGRDDETALRYIAGMRRIRPNDAHIIRRSQRSRSFWKKGQKALNSYHHWHHTLTTPPSLLENWVLLVLGEASYCFEWKVTQIIIPFLK